MKIGLLVKTANDRLAARYADLWNTGYMSQPETIAEPMPRRRDAAR
jgi:alkanesulfonate monooxygenase SsuD/methylene tetrahydromethanopterin reductase-like flavin-dependent oxidoreductase (luciferase family)